MPKVDGKHYAYTPEGIAAAEEAKKRSTFTMKYQGNSSAFPFKSPMRDEGHGGEEGHTHPKLPTSEAVSTYVAPVVKPVVGELVDPHTSLERYGYKAEMTKLKRVGKKKKLSLVEMLKKGHKRRSN